MSKALLRFIRLSPTKARLVAREVQGMNAELALASLEFTPNKAAKVIYKVIASAVANGSYEPKSVIVHSCRVDVGPVLRRFMPRARGRATPIRKPTSHVFVEVLTQSEIDSLKAKRLPAKPAIKEQGKSSVSSGKAAKESAATAKKPASSKAPAKKTSTKSETKEK